MELFYSPGAGGKYHTIEGEEASHIVRVLRKKRGDRFFLTNGKGGLFEVEIVETGKKFCKVAILKEVKTDPERRRHLHIALSPVKNIRRFEWFLEKATEIGIDMITPLLCEHSERQVIKPERLQKVIVSAAKQSLKTVFPVLNPMVDFKTFVSTGDFAGQKFIAVCRDDEMIPLKEAIKDTKDGAVILIGPEGGFSKGEIALAKQRGFLPVSLGGSRLRTETAGIVACTVFNVC